MIVNGKVAWYGKHHATGSYCGVELPYSCILHRELARKASVPMENGDTFVVKFINGSTTYITFKDDRTVLSF